MARSYKRDSHGRFASTGSTGGTRRSLAASKGSKGSSTRAANDATTKRLRSTGLTAVGGRLMGSTAAKFSGTAATKRSRAGSLAASGEGASYSRRAPKGTMTKRTRAAKPIVPATLPGQKLQHYPRIPVNSAPTAGRKAPKKRPVLDAMARPILRAVERREASRKAAPAPKAGPKRRPVLDAIARPILRATSRKKRKG